jgi:excisionase family DNA binding protein
VEDDSATRPNKIESPYLTLDEAAAYSRHSKRQVQRWLSSGALSRYGVGRRPLIYRSELEALLARGAKQPVVAP